MRGFRLQATGKLFDVNSYLNRHHIDYSSVYFKNEKDNTGNGFIKYLGNELELDIYEQEAIAYEYMKKNKNALIAAVKWENVDTVFLNLCPQLEIESYCLSICYSFSLELVTLAGEIGLEIGFFITTSIPEEMYIPFAEEFQ